MIDNESANYIVKKTQSKNNEPSYVRHKKLDVLTDVVTEGNLQPIVDELREYVHDSDMLISCRAIKCIGKIALNDPVFIEVCINALLDILQLEVDHITANCLEILQELMLKYNSVAMQVLPELNLCWEQVQDHSLGKAAIIWIYGEYGQDIPASPYHLEELIEKIEEEHSPAVKLNLLTAMMKLFFKRPPECQHALGRLLQYCIDEENNMDIRDRALFYYRLLQNIEEAKTVVLSKDTSFSTSSNAASKNINYLDFRFQEFNSLSVIYDQPSSSFVKSNGFHNEYDDVKSVPEKDPEEKPQRRSINERIGVPVDILLDMEEDNGLKLATDFTIDRDEFQSKWRILSNSSRLEEELTVPPEFEEIIAVMANSGIQLMANSPREAALWKFFFYAKLTNSNTVVLVELVINRNENRMAIQMKCESRDILRDFLEFYKHLFIGRWIAHS